MRRPLASLGAAALALLLVVMPPAAAEDDITSGPWNGSQLHDGPVEVTQGSYTLQGQFRRATTQRQIEVVLSTDPPREGACAVTPVVMPVRSTPVNFSETLTIPCNGTYRIIATATTTDNNAALPPESQVLDRPGVQVVAPAPTVTGMQLDARRRQIDLVWNDMRPAAPDLTGYSVQRKINSGLFKEIDRVASDVTSFQDNNLPTTGGTATYRVLAARPSPQGERMSTAATEKSTSFPSGATTRGSGGGSGGSTGGSGGGSGGSGGSTGGSGGGGSGDDGSDGGSTGSGGSAGRTGGAQGVAPPRLFAGTFLPPLLRPVQETLGTTTTTDPGFSDLLPYGPRRPGQPGSAADGGSLGGDENAPRRGMLIPVATALVLAIWAFHLRVLARASRPVS